MRELWIVDLGRREYGEVLELQRTVARARISGDIDQDVLLLVEHPAVVTLGRASKDAHVLATPEQLAKRGVQLFDVERGGDVTFHGPGQLVGYPIVDLKRHKQDLHWYLRQVEELLIRSLGELGIPAERVAKYTGVWTRQKKIASIGVHARDWIAPRLENAQRAVDAGLVVSGVRLVVSHRARDGRLPRGLRGAIRSSCANRCGGDSPCEGWRPVQSRVRRAPVRG